MTAELFTTPAPALAGNATPYPGAKWYFYVSGSTTPQSVFADEALSNSLGPVVTANADGRFPAIYLDASLSYRGILRDADGSVTLYDIDPIGGAASALSATLAANSGSQSIGHKSPLTGSTATTVYASFAARRANAKSDFGAAFDGTTIDTAAIQAGINALSAIGGGTLELPAGASKVGTINLPENVTIEGQGRYATRLVATTGLNAPLINRAGTISGVINRGGVANLAIVGSGKANTGMVGIKSVFTNRATYRDIDIFGCRIGHWFENVWQDVLDNIHVHGGGTDQSYIGFYGAPKDPTVGISNAVIANACVAQGVEYCGWRLENYDGSKFTSCEGMNGDYGWLLGAPSTGTVACQFGHFVNCLGDTNAINNWRIEKGSANELVQAQFSNCWAGTTSSGASVYVGGASELQFSNWQVVGGQTHGFHFFQSSRISLTGANVRAWNKADAGNAGVYLQDSLVISVTGAQLYTNTLGTGKGFIEAGTSNHNTLVGSNSSGGWTIIGANSAQSTNTTA